MKKKTQYVLWARRKEGQIQPLVSIFVEQPVGLWIYAYLERTDGRHALIKLAGLQITEPRVVTCPREFG